MESLNDGRNKRATELIQGSVNVPLYLWYLSFDANLTVSIGNFKSIILIEVGGCCSCVDSYRYI